MDGATGRRRRGQPWRPAGVAMWRLRLGRACAVVAALVVAAFTLLPASPAAAHPTLQATTPPAGYAVVQAPREVILDFGERVGLVPDALLLRSDDGRQIATLPAALSGNGRRMTATIAEELASGVYRVVWQVRAEDGDLVSGAFSFAVGASVLDGVGAGTGADVSAGAGGAGLNLPAAALRWVLFAALALGVGGAAGTVLAGRVRRESSGGGVELAAVQAPLVIAAALGLAASSGLIAVGEYGFAELLRARPGQLLAVEVVAFASALVVAGLGRVLGRPWLGTAAAAPLLVVVAAEALRAHVSALRPLAGGVLTAVHLLAAAVWIGALAQVLQAARRWRGQPGWARLLLFDYARLAVWLVIAVLATGTVQGLLLVPTAAELVGTGYGRVLLAKLAVVLLVIGCALLARRGLRRSLRPGDEPGHGRSRGLGRAVRTEIAALVGVLALTGALTSLTPPAQAAAGVALPPPPVGPAVSVGTLAGQVTVAATASTGRLVIRLTTPLDGPYDDPPESPPYRLTGQVAGKDLALVSCGTGCFTAAVDWRPGTTTLTVDVSAPPWPTGQAELDIPWPPRPAAERLAEVLARMRATGPFMLKEAVTSDYRGAPGVPRELPMTGADFVALEPYAEGAVDPVAVSGPGGDQLAIAFPANGIVVRLWLGADNRIVREVLVSPNHLITRTFDYSAGAPG